MQPGDFFNYVDLAFHIQPPARYLHPELRIALAFGDEVETQPLQQPEDVPRVEVPTQNPVYLGDPQNYRSLVHLF